METKAVRTVRVPWRSAVIVGLAILAPIASRFATAPAAPAIAGDLGVSLTAVLAAGLVSAFVATVIGLLVFLWWGGAVPSRPALLLSAGAPPLAACAMALSPPGAGLAGIAAASFVGGLSSGYLLSVLQPELTDDPRYQRGHTLGRIERVALVVNAAAALAIGITAALPWTVAGHRAGWRGAALLVGVAGLIWVVALAGSKVFPSQAAAPWRAFLRRRVLLVGALKVSARRAGDPSWPLAPGSDWPDWIRAWRADARVRRLLSEHAKVVTSEAALRYVLQRGDVLGALCQRLVVRGGFTAAGLLLVLQFGAAELGTVWIGALLLVRLSVLPVMDLLGGLANQNAARVGHVCSAIGLAGLLAMLLVTGMPFRVLLLAAIGALLVAVALPVLWLWRRLIVAAVSLAVPVAVAVVAVVGIDVPLAGGRSALIVLVVSLYLVEVGFGGGNVAAKVLMPAGFRSGSTLLMLAGNLGALVLGGLPLVGALMAPRVTEIRVEIDGLTVAALGVAAVALVIAGTIAALAVSARRSGPPLLAGDTSFGDGAAPLVQLHRVKARSGIRYFVSLDAGRHDDEDDARRRTVSGCWELRRGDSLQIDVVVGGRSWRARLRLLGRREEVSSHPTSPLWGASRAYLEDDTGLPRLEIRAPAVRLVRQHASHTAPPAPKGTPTSRGPVYSVQIGPAVTHAVLRELVGADQLEAEIDAFDGPKRDGVLDKVPARVAVRIKRRLVAEPRHSAVPVDLDAGDAEAARPAVTVRSDPITRVIARGARRNLRRFTIAGGAAVIYGPVYFVLPILTGPEAEDLGTSFARGFFAGAVLVLPLVSKLRRRRGLVVSLGAVNALVWLGFAYTTSSLWEEWQPVPSETVWKVVAFVGGVGAVIWFVLDVLLAEDVKARNADKEDWEVSSLLETVTTKFGVALLAGISLGKWGAKEIAVHYGPAVAFGTLTVLAVLLTTGLGFVEFKQPADRTPLRWLQAYVSPFTAPFRVKRKVVMVILLLVFLVAAENGWVLGPFDALHPAYIDNATSGARVEILGLQLGSVVGLLGWSILTGAIIVEALRPFMRSERFTEEVPGRHAVKSGRRVQEKGQKRFGRWLFVGCAPTLAAWAMLWFGYHVLPPEVYWDDTVANYLLEPSTTAITLLTMAVVKQLLGSSLFAAGVALVTIAKAGGSFAGTEVATRAAPTFGVVTEIQLVVALVLTLSAIGLVMAYRRAAKPSGGDPGASNATPSRRGTAVYPGRYRGRRRRTPIPGR